MKTHKGKYTIRHPEKYIGNSSNIIYRSGWEKQLMLRFDLNPSVVKWSSEEMVIPYVNPLDNKIHRYFVDFYAEIKNAKGEIIKYVFEVKPLKQCSQPIPKLLKNGKPSKSFIYETQTYIINKSKWEACKKYCDIKGYVFKIITERELNI